MSDLAGIVFNIELSLILGTITSFVLGFLLLLIKVPNTDYSKKIVNTKNSIAACYMVLSALFYVALRYSGIENYEVFASLMMFIIQENRFFLLSSFVLRSSFASVARKAFLLNGIVGFLGIAVVYSQPRLRKLS